MTKTLKVEAGNWNNFHYFFSSSALEVLSETHFLWETGSNAGGLVDQANFYALKTMFAADIASGNMEDTTIGAGLRGVHIYAFLVRVVDDNGERTELAEKVEQVIRDLQDYPVVDDEVLSELEEDTRYENFCEQLRWTSDKFVDVDHQDDDVRAKVYDLLNEDDGDYMQDDSGDWPYEAAVERALESLGYLREDADAA